MKCPFFLGQPSPSLKKMQKMPPPELRQYLASLEQELARIVERLERRGKAGATTGHDAAAAALKSRLDQLIGAGKQLLESEPGNRRIEQPRPQWGDRRGPRRPDAQR